MGYLGDADSQMGSCDSLIAKCCWSLAGGQWTPLLIIARRNWRHCLCRVLEANNVHYPLLVLWADLPPALATGSTLCGTGRGQDVTKTSLRGLTRYERRLSVSKATNAQPAGYSLSLTWRAPCLQKKHGGLSVVCSASLCIIAGRFYPWSLFSYGRNRKEVLYWRNTGWNHGHWWVFYHAFNSRSKLFRLHIF